MSEPVERLRAAAAAMRARAEAATDGPWQVRHGFPAYVSGQSFGVTINAVTADMEPADADHIASWHPAVALAVADWLDEGARRVEWHAENGGIPYTDAAAALAVADTYLGSGRDE